MKTSLSFKSFWLDLVNAILRSAKKKCFQTYQTRLQSFRFDIFKSQKLGIFRGKSLYNLYMYYVCVFIVFLLKQRANTALSRKKKQSNSYHVSTNKLDRLFPTPHCQGASHSTFLHGPNPKCCTTALSQGCQSEPWVIQKANLAFFESFEDSPGFWTEKVFKRNSSSMRCWIINQMLAYQLLLFHSLKQLLPKKHNEKSEFTRRIHLKSPKGGNINPKSHILHLCLRTIHSNPSSFVGFFYPLWHPGNLNGWGRLRAKCPWC